MQEFFLKHKKRIIGAGIAILVLVTVIASGIKLNATLLESAIGVVVTPFQDLTTGISSWIDDTVTSARNKTKLKDENEELKQQIAELTNKNRKLSMYETENERLTALLKIAQKYPTYDSVGARVIAKDPGIWYDGFTINKGTTSSISANMVLIAPEGLVGKVLESGATFSKAQSILDSRSSVPAMSVRTGDLGVVKGNYSLANHGLCKMEYIDGDAEIMVGDEIVTSQLSDIYPEGLAIGKVLEIETDTNGLTKYAVIEPYVDLKHLIRFWFWIRAQSRVAKAQQRQIHRQIPTWRSRQTRPTLTRQSLTQRGWRNENHHHHSDCGTEFYFADHALPLPCHPRGIPEYRLDYCNLLFPAARQ